MESGTSFAINKNKSNTKMDIISLTLLPEEVWDIILGMLDDSRDILNALKAYPELDVILKRKRCLWLFDQAIPHLFLWLPTNDFLHCRQACSRWTRAVDNFLGNHPSLIAHEPGGQLWIPRTHPRHYKLMDHFPRVSFSSSAQLTKFMEGMCVRNRPGNRNPFVGRSIKIAPQADMDNEDDNDDDHDELDEDLEIDRFWSLALDLLTIFGEHVWFIEIRAYQYQYQTPLSFCKSVAGYMAHLSNIKSLTLSGRSNASDSDNESDSDIDEQGVYSRSVQVFLTSRMDEVPSLPNLETIIMEGIPQSMAFWLLGNYCHQIRQLSLEPGFWDREYSADLPNLTELSVVKVGSKEEVTNLLEEIVAPKLSSLRVKFRFGDEDDPVLVEEDIFPWLKRFPRIQHLEWVCRNYAFIKDGETPPPNVWSFPSLKSLVITDDFEQGYNFLFAFPSLEYLIIAGWKSEDEEGDSDDDEDNATSGIIRKCLINMAGDEIANSIENIWSHLKNLKRLTLEEYNELDYDDDDDDDAKEEVEITRFSRDVYDYERKMWLKRKTQLKP